MKTPLIRQGEGNQGLDRIHDERAEEAHRINRMITTANLTTTQQEQRARNLIGARSAEGDEQRLRGIPAIGRGVAGAIPGTKPGATLWT
jgi:hypothetical protein